MYINEILFTSEHFIWSTNPMWSFWSLAWEHIVCMFNRHHNNQPSCTLPQLTFTTCLKLVSTAHTYLKHKVLLVKVKLFSANCICIKSVQSRCTHMPEGSSNSAFEAWFLNSVQSVMQIKRKIISLYNKIYIYFAVSMLVCVCIS